MSYQSDRSWSDQYIPAIKQIVGPLLLDVSSFEVDTKNATDLIVLRVNDKMIAARVRRPGYADRYPYEFTIRSQRDSGAETELRKVISGWGDWMFYGHAAEGGGISRWFVLSLPALRAELIRRPDELGWEKKSNGDGTHFVAFDLRTFVEPIIVASSHEVPSLVGAEA